MNDQTKSDSAEKIADEIRLHETTDCTKWAAEFCRIAKGLGHNVDEGWMQSWFANAIETGRMSPSKITPPDIEWAEGLHRETNDLVSRFARALGQKLRAAELKYCYNAGWTRDDWMDECRQHLMEHVRKGDPRDVAAYCAFLWHHGQSTALPPSATAQEAASVKDSLAVPLHAIEPGQMFRHGETLALMTEYGDCEAYIVGSGEMFWGGTDRGTARRVLLVTPCAQGAAPPPQPVSEAAAQGSVEFGKALDELIRANTAADADDRFGVERERRARANVERLYSLRSTETGR